MSDMHEQESGGIDVGRLEKVVSRVSGLIVIGGLAGYMILMGGQRAPFGLMVALVGSFAVGKLIVLGVGVKEKWPAWPAVLLELFAFGVVAFVVLEESRQSRLMLGLVAVVVLFMGSAFVRRRARARAVSPE